MQNPRAEAYGAPQNQDVSPFPQRQDEKATPKVRMQQEGEVLQVEVSGDFSKLQEAAGSDNVLAGLLHQISATSSPGKLADDDAANFVLGFVDGMHPQDPAEVLLLTQMATIHQATMTLAHRLNRASVIPQQDAAERALNKLARTYAAQVEALKRYRSKGQQVVRVERVTVESGAQAVVGNVNHGGGAHG
ncbi:hypothetical protein [Paracoccus litorisediminis]|uniref:Uncharacterized protein n=1 Tax=Paracoccus litorisediminis TaxID=2006130 RepID=A0A844HGB2_9RHOB|nr:hypothetical protein [Paracoccus litorisediminis]MTH57878.1 hypothetical protein [Paracoccus litorisediminis]